MGWLSVEVAMIIFPFFMLIIGFIIGYLAQQSGFCSIGGFRDLFLFKHTRLVLGYVSLIISAFISYLIFSLIIPSAFPGFFWALEKTQSFSPIPGAPGGVSILTYLILAIIGGFGLGILGVFLGGCPLRQIVMASEGNHKSLYFVLGMCVGAVIFHVWISPAITALFGI